MHPIQDKPSRNEEEFARRRDAELIRERRAMIDAQRAVQERKSHLMKCPSCGSDLAMSEFHHIRVERCRDCGGLWFDKNEIEMLEHIDMSQIRQFMRAMFGLNW